MLLGGRLVGGGQVEDLEERGGRDGEVDPFVGEKRWSAEADALDEDLGGWEDAGDQACGSACFAGTYLLLFERSHQVIL